MSNSLKWTMNSNYLFLKLSYGLLELFCTFPCGAQKLCVFMESFIDKEIRLKIEKYFTLFMPQGSISIFQTFSKFSNICTHTLDLRTAPRIPAVTCRIRIRSKPMKNWRRGKEIHIILSAFSNIWGHFGTALLSTAGIISQWECQSDSSFIPLFTSSWKFWVLYYSENFAPETDRGKWFRQKIIKTTMGICMILTRGKSENWDEFIWMLFYSFPFFIKHNLTQTQNWLWNSISNYYQNHLASCYIYRFLKSASDTLNHNLEGCSPKTVRFFKNKLLE